MFKNILKQAWKVLSTRSILWRAVLHSMLVWSLTMCAITLAAFLVTRWLIHAQVTTSLQLFFPQGLSEDSATQVSAYANTAAIQLAQFLLAIGIVSLIPIGLLSYVFARHLTGPILDVASKVRRFQPGAWIYRPTATTGDEVQLLDETITDMARRLQDLYARMAHTVAEKSDKLRREVAKDQTVLAALPIGVLVVNKEGVITETNTAVTRLLKRKEGEIIGNSAVTVLDLHNDEGPLTEANHPVTACLTKNEAKAALADDRISAGRGDGSTVPVQIHAAPFAVGKSQGGAVVLIMDVTSQREVNDMKNEFISLASHQLRTPLSSLQWYLELLTGGEGGPLTVQQEAFVAELRLAARRMSSVVAGLMDASRLQHGFVEPVKQPVDVQKAAIELQKDIHLIAADKTISCTVHAPDYAVVIQTDPLLLNVVLQNLLSNAVKYSKNTGTIDIALSEEKDTIQISVKDSGIGIPAADQARIFEKMFRARNSQALDVNGSGLGLYSSRMIMRMLGGTLDFQSEEDKGTAFTVTLPKT